MLKWHVLPNYRSHSRRHYKSMEKLLTIGEVAEIIKFSPQTIRRWVLNCEIPFHKLVGGVRFSPAEIEAWVAKNRIGKPGGSQAGSGGELFGEVASGPAAKAGAETAGGGND